MENSFLRNGRWYPCPPFSQSSAFDPDRPEGIRRAKVVQIPVHFVGSDRPGSALKVQKVFRGFMVRKCLKKIKAIKAQVDAIEERLSKGEVMELVRRDSKERLRVNEDLMSLLFKLDSICGVDFGVRGCRKAVIRKAIALQERIDAIVAGDDDWEVVSNRASRSEGGNLDSEVEIIDGEVEIIDVGVDREVKVRSYECCEGRRNGEMLERIMEDNGKMMKMMTHVLERNESQSRMINALVNRVEMLEKAFVCDTRLRNKNKKKNNKVAASC